MTLSNKEKRRILDQSFKSVKVLFHQDSSATVIWEKLQRLFWPNSEGCLFYLADATGVSIESPHFEIEVQMGQKALFLGPSRTTWRCLVLDMHHGPASTLWKALIQVILQVFQVLLDLKLLQKVAIVRSLPVIRVRGCQQVGNLDIIMAFLSRAGTGLWWWN